MCQKKVYVFPDDICVACGAPTIPGEQICRSCQKIADGTWEVLPPAPAGTQEKTGIRDLIRRVLVKKPARK